MVGEIIAYPSTDIPDGFLKCDGSAISRTDYADLFTVIGTSYGNGDGSTTFNLPDLVGKVPISVSNSHALGTSGGEETVILDTTEIPSHLHNVPQHGHANTILATTPSLSHSITAQPAFTYTQVNGTRSIDIYNTGSSVITSRTATAVTLSTKLAISDHAASACTMSGSVVECAELTSGSNGSGAAHNNMMPYLALTYLIRYAPDVPPGPKMAYYNGALPVGPLGGYISGITR